MIGIFIFIFVSLGRRESSDSFDLVLRQVDLLRVRTATHVPHLLDEVEAHVQNSQVSQVLQVLQSRDLVDAMARDMAAAGAGAPGQLRVDGGFTANNLAMQFLADLIGMPVDRPINLETTAAGAAMLAGLAAGVIPDITALADMRQTDQVFNRLASADQMDEAYDGWQRAVARVRSDQT